MKNIVFINSHPIQYFVPLYQQLTREYGHVFTLKVLYLSDETLNGYQDKQFGTRIQWDLPMLDGYAHTFVPNNSWKPSFYNGFFGLINWGLIGELRRMPKSIVISHGWAYASNIIALWAAKSFGHTVCMRGESPVSHELTKRGLKKKLRNYYLKWFVFNAIDHFLYVGEQNRQFYKSFDVRDDKLIFTPYAVDNERFRQQYDLLLPQRDSIREEMGLAGKRVILYSGKLIAKKRPLDLLRAYAQLRSHQPDLALVFVGDGELRTEIETYCQHHALTDVRITGFVNQNQIARYYTMADLFVMCSGVGETWGLSVNEAMNFALPLVLTDLTGSSDDLVAEGQNGVVVPAGNVEALGRAIDTVLATSAGRGQASLELVSQYSYNAIGEALKTLAA